MECMPFRALKIHTLKTYWLILIILVICKYIYICTHTHIYVYIYKKDVEEKHSSYAILMPLCIFSLLKFSWICVRDIQKTIERKVTQYASNFKKAR